MHNTPNHLPPAVGASTLPGDPAADLHLTYVLSRYPQAISTFINGEIAAVAGRAGRVSVRAVLRTVESDPRPGGIPARVDVGWLPMRNEPRFWREAAVGIARHPATALGSVRFVAGSAGGTLPALRRASLVVAAIAESATWAAPGRMPPNHLHAHFAAEGALAAHTMARATSVPYSVTVHGSADLFRVNPHLDRLTRDARFIVAVSEFHRAAVLERVPALPPERVVVIPVGVPTEALARLGRAKREPEPEPASRAGRTRIVSVANLGPTKGMPVLVDAVASLVREGRDVELAIVGDGPERRSIEDRVLTHDLGDRVQLLGRRTPAESHAIMAAADCVALACVVAPDGSHDGLPTVLMEAMAMGVPVVSTRVSAIPELIMDGETGRLADPGDPNGLAAAIADTLDDREASTQMVERGLERVQSRHDQRTNADRLIDEILTRG